MQHVIKNEPMTRGAHRLARSAVAGGVLLFMAACGGGSGSTDGTASTSGSLGVATASQSAPDAARFLTQATFGPTPAEIERVKSMSYSAWMDEQFAKPQSLHRLYLNQASADLAANGQTVSASNFFDSYWAQAIGGEDQLRQRAAFALSEIMVISFTDATLRNQPRGVASYYDTLGADAFGNFRTLMEDVTLHPMMGIYLSHLKNEKEDVTTGRVPDLNFAREITQLFTVGEYKLNPDGTTIMGTDGHPAVAYKSADLEGLSQIFTGWSWYGGPELTDRTNARFFGNNANIERDWRPMQDYTRYSANTDFHSISAKNFFGVTIAPQTVPDTVGDLKIALDTLFNNPNVGPFVGKQLIQRMVTSNPSPAYVGRVSAAFANNGSGVRGDMKAVFRAVLLDPEARTATNATTYGKLREPVVRLANFMRAFNVKSVSGRYTGIGSTDDAATQLNQTPMFSPTVFNFFRPGYVPTSRVITDAGLVAPELQITHDLSVAGYMNYMRNWITVNNTRDLRQDYSAEVALADNAGSLVDRMNLLLFSGAMPDALKTQITSAVASRAIPAPTYSTTDPSAGGTLTKVADEGGGFTIAGTGTIRYGADASFISMTVTGSGQCTNEFFGNDPLVGVGKACYLFTPTPSSTAPAASAPKFVSNQSAIDAAKLDRVYLAVYLSMSSPDYLIQK